MKSMSEKICILILCINVSACLKQMPSLIDEEPVEIVLMKLKDQVSGYITEHINPGSSVAINNYESSEIYYSNMFLKLLLQDLKNKKISIITNTLYSDFEQSDFSVRFVIKDPKYKLKKSSTYKTQKREFSCLADLEIRNSLTKKIVFKKKFDYIYNDKIYRKNILKPKLGPSKNYMRNDYSSGVSDWAAIGFGFCQWENLSYTVEAGVGYRLNPDVTLGLNIAYFPYSFTKQNNYEEKFTGQVIPVFVTAESQLFQKEKFKFFASLGTGAYIYIAQIKIPNYINNSLWYYQPSPEYSASEINWGSNVGLGLSMPLNENVNLRLNMRYHYNDYDFGDTFQFFNLGINYSFN